VFCLGKSTLLKLLAGELTPDSGEVNMKKGLAVALARQVMPRDRTPLTIWEYFKREAQGNESGLDSRIASALGIVQLEAPHDRLVGSFSGGQQARLLLAAALLQEPDMLLLDEPTNNLDVRGVAYLKEFIKEMDKTVIVRPTDTQPNFKTNFLSFTNLLGYFSRRRVFELIHGHCPLFRYIYKENRAI
jgi:ATPase subunit of ABC transporter with duplicated ATPase domains